MKTFPTINVNGCKTFEKNVSPCISDTVHSGYNMKITIAWSQNLLNWHSLPSKRQEI